MTHPSLKPASASRCAHARIHIYEARTGAHNACAREIAKRVRYPDRCTCQHAHIVAAKFDVRTHSRTVPFWSRRAVSSESRFCAQSLVPLRCLTDLIAPSLHSSLSPSLPLSPSPSLPLSLSPPLPLSLSPALPLSPSLPLSLSLSLPRSPALSREQSRARASARTFSLPRLLARVHDLSLACSRVRILWLACSRVCTLTADGHLGTRRT